MSLISGRLTQIGGVGRVPGSTGRRETATIHHGSEFNWEIPVYLRLTVLHSPTRHGADADAVEQR